MPELDIKGIESNTSILPSVEQALSDQVSALQVNADAPSAFVRTAYEIDIVGQTLSELIAPFYEPYERVVVVEYGYYMIYPIISSCTFAVGIMPDGSMEECSMPMDIVSRIFDYAALNELHIVQLPIAP